MSRKGNCWDNAVAESFFSSFTFELEADAEWHDVHDVERDAAEYIDGFYNPQRRHSHNRYLNPVDFERRFLQQRDGDVLRGCIRLSDVTSAWSAGGQ